VGGDGIWARRETSMPADTWRDRSACIGTMHTAAKVWLCDEEECYMTYLPLRGLYLNLSARGSLVFCPTQGDSFNSRVSGQTILPGCFISLLYMHRFSSPFCRESVL
jgi:hypothetical protein